MSIDFDGTDQYLTCGSGASIDGLFDAGGSMVFHCIVDAYVNAAAGDRIAEKVLTTSKLGWITGPKDNAGDTVKTFILLHYFSDTAGVWKAPDNSVSLGAMTHFVVTYNNNNVANNPAMYINGTSVAVTEVSTPVGTRGTDGAQTLSIGSDAANVRPFNGKVEDFRLYKRILSAEEAAILAAGFRGPLGGEAMWLSMTEARGVSGGFGGASLTNGTNLCPDLSANSNDGDPVNTPTGVASEFPRYGVAV